MITGVRKVIKIGKVHKETQGIISYEIRIDEEKWKIISVYNNAGRKIFLEGLEEELEKKAGQENDNRKTL